MQSKGGVLQLTRSLAPGVGDRGVRVNAIAPTLLNTALIEPTRPGRPSPATSSWPACRAAPEPHELVGAAIFLASDASSLVTGATLPVDDGYLVA